jgi:hypothetical protein
VNGKLVGERHIRQADRQARCVLIIRLLNIFEIGAYVSMRNDIGERQHFQIAAGVVVVLVRVQYVDDRFVGDRSDGCENAFVVPVEHVVDENDANACDIGRNVAALAGQQIEPGADRFDIDRGGGFQALGLSESRRR